MVARPLHGFDTEVFIVLYAEEVPMMSSVPARPRIAIVNSSEDLLEILQSFFEQEGYVVATAHARALREEPGAIERLIAGHDPKVLVWDIAPPYEENWHALQAIKQLPSMQGRRFVLTSTNARNVREIVGGDEEIIEVVGKPFDLQQLLGAVAQAAAG
jgi:CheY-like chemotaxis protein